MDIAVATKLTEYPKIDTLFGRDERTHKVIPGQLRRPEFGLIDSWVVTEKIDGTNVRVALMPDGSVVYTGRTDDAQMNPKLLDYLRATFPVDKMRHAGMWSDEVPPLGPFILFGEGYGPKIQKGGAYRGDIAFRLFDVLSDTWWLKDGDVKDVAIKLGISTVPELGVYSTENAIALVRGGLHSETARIEGGTISTIAEGIVARPAVQLFNRQGERVMWKLKAKDFA